MAANSAEHLPVARLLGSVCLFEGGESLHPRSTRSGRPQFIQRAESRRSGNYGEIYEKTSAAQFREPAR